RPRPSASERPPPPSHHAADPRVRTRDVRFTRRPHRGRAWLAIPPARAHVPRSGVYGSGMGTVYYGGEATPIEIEDRALAHLKIVIATKLRRGESFTLSWRHPEGQARGRTTI